MLLKIDDSINETHFNGTYWKLRDASLNRVMYHDKNGMFIISAMRGGFPKNKTFDGLTPAEQKTYRENLRKTEELKQDIRKEGLGYIQTLGGWPESTETGNTIDVQEISFIVPRNPNIMDEEEFVEFGIELMKKYAQDAILVAGISFIADGQARFIKSMPEPGNAEIDETLQLSAIHPHKEINVEERPYYTQLAKKGETNFVYDEQSYRNLSKYVASRKPHGAAAYRLANENNEIILY